MKTTKKIIRIVLALFIIGACTDNLRDFNYLESIAAPSNLSATYSIAQDNTGEVTISPVADGAKDFDVYFGDATTSPVKVPSGESVKHTYAEGNYEVKMIAYNINGETAEHKQPLVVSFKAPQNLIVLIENDKAVSKQVNITAKAEFATMYEFYTGELGNTTPITGNIGETISYTYAAPGKYSVKVIAKGAAIATTEYTADFDVTEILAPTEAAPLPPTRLATDVVSIYSDKYTNVNVSEWNPNWGQSTVLTTETIQGNNTLRYASLNYTGIVTDYGNPTDVSAMEYVHFDYWTPDATSLSFKLVNTSKPAGADKESEVAVPSIEFGTWKSVDIKLSDYTTDLTGITQMLFSSSSAIVFIDNLYFYKSPSAANNVTPITFEAPFSLSSFDGGAISMVANPDTNGNSSSMVAKMVKGGGQVWAGSKITVNNAFSFAGGSTVKAKVWSPRAGLKLLMKFEDATPWPNTVASAEVTATTTTANAWEELTFDFTGISTTVDFTNLVLIMDNGTNGDGSANYTIYVDDISLANFLNFEPLQVLSSFDGGDISIVANPDTNGNTSAMVAKMVKGGGQVWAGSKITVPRPFTFGGTTIKVKVWSPRAGLNLLMKFEDATPWPNTVASAEVTATTTTANAWEELTFNFSGISTSVDFTNMVLIMDNGTNGDGTANYTIYLDDITQQ